MTTTYQLWYIREASVAVCVGSSISLFSGIPDRTRALRTPTAGWA